MAQLQEKVMVDVFQQHLSRCSCLYMLYIYIYVICIYTYIYIYVTETAEDSLEQKWPVSNVGFRACWTCVRIEHLREMRPGFVPSLKN